MSQNSHDVSQNSHVTVIVILSHDTIKGSRRFWNNDII